jgi:hypothetical protein
VKVTTLLKYEAIGTMPWRRETVWSAKLLRNMELLDRNHMPEGS